MRNGLSQNQEVFTQGLFVGNTQRDSYREAYHPTYALSTIDANASRLANTEKIKVRLAELRGKTEDESVMSVIERKQRLSEISRANLVDFVNEEGNITLEAPNNGALQELTVTAGPVSKTTNTKVKLLNPITAMAELNKMERVYEPDGTTNILNQILNVNVVSESARKATERIVQGERTE